MSPGWTGERVKFPRECKSCGKWVVNSHPGVLPVHVLADCPWSGVCAEAEWWDNKTIEVKS